MTNEKYTAAAERWTEEAYADAGGYLERRASAVLEMGPALEPGDEVLDLACGDGGFAEPLLAAGMRYRGADANESMAAAAARRLAGRAAVDHADMNVYAPPARVEATCCFRALYYVPDRPAFLRSMAGYTAKKFVFDLAPRRYSLGDVRRDLEAAGFDRLELRPFFAPQTRRLPPAATAALTALERSGPLARALLRYRFSYVCAASRTP